MKLPNNGFAKRGIKRTSASQMKKMMTAPCAYITQYVLKEKFPFDSVAADIGSSVEDGVEFGLFNPEAAPDEYNQVTIDNFISRRKGDPTLDMLMDKLTDELKYRTENAVNEMRPLGVPTRPDEKHKRFGKLQHPLDPKGEGSVTIKFGDGEDDYIAVTGFLDFMWENDGLIIDLKCPGTAPEEWSLKSRQLDHCIQAALYQRVTNYRVRFLYSLKRKNDPIVYREIHDTAPYIQLIKQNLAAMNRILDLPVETHELVKYVNHDPSSFYWNGATEIREKYFGTGA